MSYKSLAQSLLIAFELSGIKSLGWISMKNLKLQFRFGWIIKKAEKFFF
jgi:hypothetical protein